MRGRTAGLTGLLGLGLIVAVSWPVYAHCGKCMVSAKEMVDQAQVTLASAISTAEGETQGKAVFAQLKKQGKADQATAGYGVQQRQGTTPGATGTTPGARERQGQQDRGAMGYGQQDKAAEGDLVYQVICIAEDRMVQVKVDAANGEVLGKQDIQMLPDLEDADHEHDDKDDMMDDKDDDMQDRT